MDAFVSNLVVVAKSVAIGIFVLGLIAYGIFLFLAFFGRRADWRKLTEDNAASVLGLPVSAATSFAIVTILEVTSGGNLNFKAFNLAFEGPASPVTLWLVCYVSLVATMRLARPGASKPVQGGQS